MDATNEHLARLVARMRLPSVHDLKLADALRDASKPIRIREDQIRPLVWRGAARKADRHHCFVQTHTTATLYLVQQRALRESVRIANLIERNPDRIPEIEVV